MTSRSGHIRNQKISDLLAKLHSLLCIQTHKVLVALDRFQYRHSISPKLFFLLHIFGEIPDSPHKLADGVDDLRT